MYLNQTCFMTKQNVVSEEIIREVREESRRRNITDGSKIKHLGFIRTGVMQIDLHNQSYIIAIKNIYSRS